MTAATSSLGPRPTTTRDAIVAAATTPPWSHANFVPTAGKQGSDERRNARWGLRGVNRQPGVSALKRVADCGRPIGNSPVKIKKRADGGGHVAGVETCASVWSCPVCAASIRNFRAEEISRGLHGHIAAGGGALFVTLTIPHEAAHALARTVDLVSEGFRALQRGRAYKTERDAYGVLGHIRAFEVTHGPSGWHPHLHLVLVLAAPITARAAAELERAWLKRWNRWLTRNGWKQASAAHGVRVDLVRRDAKAVAVYVSKLQEGDGKVLRTNVANEVSRSDLKRAKQGEKVKRGKGFVSAYRVPFAILADFGTDGAREDLDLWQEYQLGTKGRSAIRWSVGLRALLLPDEDELTDDEIVAADKQGDEVVAVIVPALYRKILRRPYADAYLQVAAEQGGLDGVKRFIRSLGYPDGGVHPPEALTHWEEITELWEHIREKEQG